MPLTDIVIRLLVAAVIGCLIGLNRFAHHRYIGVRTLGLVALGAAALVVAVLESGSGGDQLQAASRVIQGIVTGIGFIGAGVIVQRERSRKVHGLTTAATVWVSAAAGVVCGLGAWRVATTVIVLAGIVLLAGGRAERLLIAKYGSDPETGPQTPGIPPKPAPTLPRQT
jgi:putative Mg2+ transporter-C (MgtC) family protein